MTKLQHASKTTGVALFVAALLSASASVGQVSAVSSGAIMKGIGDADVTITPEFNELTGHEDLLFIEVLVVEMDYDESVGFGAMHEYLQRTDAMPNPRPSDSDVRNRPSDHDAFAGVRPGEQGDVRNAQSRFPLLGNEFRSGSELSFRTDLDAGVVYSTLQALVNDGRGKVLAKPSITTVDGFTAKITTSEIVPFLARRTESSGRTNNHTLVTEFKQVGLELTVTPHVIYKKTGDLLERTELISMHVSPEDTTITRYRMEGDFPMPIVDARKHNAEVVVRSGQTFLMSGLLRKRDSQFKRGLPVLMDMPAIGALASKSEGIALTTELVVTVTPTIVESRIIDLSEDINELRDTLEQRVRELDEWQEGVRENIQDRGPSGKNRKKS